MELTACSHDAAHKWTHQLAQSDRQDTAPCCSSLPSPGPANRSMGTWEYGNMGTWEYGNMGAWEHGSMGNGSMGNGSMTIWKQMCYNKTAQCMCLICSQHTHMHSSHTHTHTHMHSSHMHTAHTHTHTAHTRIVYSEHGIAHITYSEHGIALADLVRVLREAVLGECYYVTLTMTKVKLIGHCHGYMKPYLRMRDILAS